MERGREFKALLQHFIPSMDQRVLYNATFEYIDLFACSL